jgi:AcrR family transcriptional regulator
LTRKEEALETRTKILTAAIEVFKKHGYHQTSMEQVAKDAQVSKGSVFHHFESKTNLALTIIKEISFQYIHQLRDLSHLQKLTVDSILSAALDDIASGLGLTQLLFSLFLEHITTQDSKELDKLSRMYIEPIYAEMATIFQKLELSNPKLKSRLFFATLDGLAIQFSLENRWDDQLLLESLINEIKTMLLSH